MFINKKSNIENIKIKKDDLYKLLLIFEEENKIKFSDSKNVTNYYLRKNSFFAVGNEKDRLFLATEIGNLYKVIEKISNEKKSVKNIFNICDDIFYEIMGYSLLDESNAPSITEYFYPNLHEQILEASKDTKTKEDFIKNMSDLYKKHKEKNSYKGVLYRFLFSLFVTFFLSFVKYKWLEKQDMYGYSTQIFLSLFALIIISYERVDYIWYMLTWPVIWYKFKLFSKLKRYIRKMRNV